GVIRSRRSDSTSKRSCIGQASLSKGAPKCMQSMKRAGLVFLCSAISRPWASNATWSVRRSWMSAQRVKTDGLDAKALCLKLDRFVQGNRDALALVRVPTEEEEQNRAIHRQREQLVKTRKVLEAQGRSLMVNHGMEPVQQWWKRRAFAQLSVPEWMKELLSQSQPILLLLEEKIHALTVQLQAVADPKQPRG